MQLGQANNPLISTRQTTKTNLKGTRKTDREERTSAMIQQGLNSDHSNCLFLRGPTTITWHPRPSISHLHLVSTRPVPLHQLIYIQILVPNASASCSRICAETSIPSWWDYTVAEPWGHLLSCHHLVSSTCLVHRHRMKNRLGWRWHSRRRGSKVEVKAGECKWCCRVDVPTRVWLDVWVQPWRTSSKA